MHQRFLRFLGTGAIAAGADFGTLFVVTRLFDLPPIAALACSGTASFLTLFLLHRFFTFRDRPRGSLLRQAVLFTTTYGGTALLNFLLSSLFVLFGLPDVFLAKIAATAVLLFLNFFLLDRLVFRR